MTPSEIFQSEPVHLAEEPNTGDKFLIYATDMGVQVELRYEGEMLWMSQAQIAGMFGVTVPTINEHIRNIYAEDELDEDPTIRNFRIVRTEGSREVSRYVLHYNLDAIISVGYRVSSRQGTLIRKWATEKIVQFATKGFVVDSERLKDPNSRDRFTELREIIRDIRSDERNVYRELRSICALCQDYDGESATWRDFYQRTQAKLMWAVTSHTPSEIIASRADANFPNMGLQTWPNDNIRKNDSEVAKNYLKETEIRELNRLTTILLDIFEDQLDLGLLTMMLDVESLLDAQLKQLNRPVLRRGGKVKSSDAKKHAHAQYGVFNEERRVLRHAEADANLAALKEETKTIKKERKSKK